MSTATATAAETGGFWDNVQNLVLDVARAKYIDVEQGDEDRNIPDQTDINIPGQSDNAMTFSTKTMLLMGVGALGLLFIAKRVL